MSRRPPPGFNVPFAKLAPVETLGRPGGSPAAEAQRTPPASKGISPASGRTGAARFHTASASSTGARGGASAASAASASAAAASASAAAASASAAGADTGTAAVATSGVAPEDAELFLRAMSGVASLPHDAERVEPQKTLERMGPDDEAVALMELESLVRGETAFELTAGEELISGVAPGVTHELLRSLRDGNFAFHRHLDLHGLHRDEAHAALIAFVNQARRDNERCVLLITGRGKGSPDGISVLKEALPRWLSRAPIRSHVLAFCTALPIHGGPGAFYVLLRRQGVRPFGAPPHG